MERAELFSNLVHLAAVDGKFTDEEVQFLVERAERWGIPTDEFETALAGLSEGVQLRLPPDKTARLELLREMIRLMAVDGELADTEKSLCAAASATMEISSAEFAQLVDSMLR
jgi:uncharacterized tellurite resistance protein B-like protein